MQLTENQERYISQYIGEIEESIGDQLSPKQRDRALSRLRARLDEKIRSGVSAPLEDADVLNILHKMGDPETQAAILVRVWGDVTIGGAALTPSETSPTSASNPNASSPSSGQTAKAQKGAPSKGNKFGPVWLGVVSYFARRSGLPLWALRLLASLLGLLTGPLALMTYMAAYIVLRLRGRLQSPAPFHFYRVVLYPAITGILLLLFYFGGVYGIMGIRMAHEKYLGRTVPELNEWAWLEVEAPSIFVSALFILLPLSLFSAMPLANGWDYSLKRFTQAGVILYAVILSFGIAFFLTGIILNFVHEFT